MAILFGLALAACAGPAPDTTPNPPPASVVTAPPAPVEPQRIQVGIVVPMSGQAAEVGKALQDAAELALFDLNAPDIELLPADAGTSAATASGAVQNVLVGGADILIGPLGATSVKAAAPAARARGLTVLGFSTDRGAAGGGVYLMGFMPEEQVSTVISYATETSLKRFAALIPQGAYGEVVGAAFEVAVGSHGGVVAGIERYKSGNLQPTESLKALLAPGPDGRPQIDALFVPEGGDALRQVTGVLAGLGFDPRAVRLLGTDQWAGSSLGSDPLTLGGWYAGPPPERFERFASHFQGAYGHRPPRIAAQAYDAMTLAVLLSKQVGGMSDTTRILTAPDGFAGVDGLFRFRADGIPQRGLAILEVTASGPQAVRPAPETFTGVGY